MSGVTVGKFRVYARKFDHDEARRRHADGETLYALAREYGVSDQAVRRVVVPGEDAKMRATIKAYYASSCEVCGIACLSHRHPVKADRGVTRDLCNPCASRLRRNKTRPDDDGRTCIRCHACHEWRPVTDFGPRVGRCLREGKRIMNTTCRACSAASRQAYRERNKVPCSVCGDPCLPPSEKKSNGADFPRCRKCFYASRRRASA